MCLYFLSLIVLCLIICVVYKILCQSRKLSFTFAIEIVSNKLYYYVDVCKLHGSMEDYVNTATELIKDINIVGWLRPTMKFKWENLKFVDQITQAEFTIQNEIAISWYKGRQLGKVFREEFKINPILCSMGV